MDVEKRLVVLERRVKVMAGLVVVLGGTLLMGASGGSVPKEVRARTFTLVGPDGEVLSRWDSSANADPADRHARLDFFDGHGRNRITMSCFRDGTAMVGVGAGRKDDQAEARLEIGPDTNPRIVASGKDGQSIFTRP